MKTKILELEKKYWKGMEDHDFEAVRRLTRFPCIVAGKEGVRSVDEVSFRKMFDSGQNVPMKVLEISGVETQAIGENAAVIAYIIGFEHTIEGEKSSGICACSSSWVRENGEWLCAMHTESDLKQKVRNT